MKPLGFSTSQQIKFRALVDRAWSAHCRANSIDPKSPLKRAWYEGTLLAECGQDSTTKLDRTRGYEDAMAAFEAIVGDDIYWQMRRFSGDARRITHELSQVCHRHDKGEHYMRAIARQILQTDDLPELRTLDPRVLATILRALKIQLARDSRHAPSSTHSVAASTSIGSTRSIMSPHHAHA